MAPEQQPDEWQETRQAVCAQMLPREKIEAFCRRIGLPYVPTWAFLNRRRAPSVKFVAMLRSALADKIPPMPGEGLDVVTDIEAAGILGLSRPMVHRLKSKGIIKPVGSSNRILYLRSEIETLRDARAAIAATAPKDSGARSCRRCRRPLTKKSQRKYCTRLCSDARNHPSFRPKTALGKEVNERWEASGLGLTRYANTVCRVDVGTLTRVLKDEPIWLATFNTLNATLGGNLPAPTRTVNDVWSEEGQQRLQKEGKKHPFHKYRSKGHAARRGSKRSAEATAKQRKTQQESPAFQAHIDRLKARRGSPEWRARLFMVSRLRITKNPSDELLSQWLDEAVQHFKAEGLNMSPDTIRWFWRKTLVKIGRLPPGGRPTKNGRCRIIADELVRRPAGQRHRIPDSVWDEIAVQVSLVEHVDPPIEGRSLERWYRRHRPHERCPLAALRQQ